MNIDRLFQELVLCFLILISPLVSASAQNTTDGSNSNGGAENSLSAAQKSAIVEKSFQIGYWGGTSTFHKDLVGASAGGNFVFGAIRFSKIFKEGKHVKLKYFLDVIPVAVLNYPRERVFQKTPALIVDRSRQTVYGFGVAPVGLQINFRNHKKYQPYIAGSLGVLYFTKVVVDNRTPLNPRATGAKLNFTAELGAGLEIRLKNDKNFFVGYKYFHISNAYTGNINVGFNANMIYTGINFNRKILF